jgi:hypothetical protein
VVESAAADDTTGKKGDNKLTTLEGSKRKVDCEPFRFDMILVRIVAGGIAALNRRLMAQTPPGSRDS